jgi:hypothetical protein
MKRMLEYGAAVTRARAWVAQDRMRGRVVVLIAALVTTAGKLTLAATTHGTNDIRHWQTFARLVGRLGPVKIYSTHLVPPFNHPPLTSFMLVGINAITRHVSSVRFLIRVPASVADIVTALLVFELVRRVRGLREATAAGVIVALSPVLLIISGFHGNTDPVFVMFTFLSAYLLLRDRPGLAGASAALACSVKLVPIVALPALAAYAWRDGRRLGRMIGAFLLVFLVLWLPAISQQWSGLKRNVIDYTGWDHRDPHWGLVDLAHRANLPGLVSFLPGSGRFLILVVSSLIPAALVWRRRNTLAIGVGLSLALFLLLTPTFSMQYLAWAAAGVLLLNVWAGAAYNLGAGVFLFIVYNRWSHGFPWDRADAGPLLPNELRYAWLAWLILLVCVVLGVIRMWQWRDEQTDALEPARPTDREFASDQPALVST